MPSYISGASPKPAPPNPAKQEALRREDRIVAVVDDDVAECDSTRTLLEVHDFVVHTYQSGAAFLQEQPTISCLIVDYHLPGLNGLELVSELRNRGSSVPAIMITAASDGRIEAEAAQLGIRSILKKPLGKALIAALQDELGEG